MAYESWIKNCFLNTCKLYGLKLVTVDDQIYALIGSNYMLCIYVFHDEVSVAYFRRNEKNVLMKWTINEYEIHLTNDDDRHDIRSDGTVQGNIKKEIHILSRTMERCFQNLWEGKIDWLEDYKRSPYAAEPRQVCGYMKEFAEKYL